ncbi:DUF2642 domain-containing protein [Priestia megaterium]|uniref:DUF2642 domain-containing protein n=1 Tax=Priestia megaterium TaxID=1404 RepID=UPI000762B9B9|nr:DUF2642 domain-containing protein [Priestia megaterium]KWU56508.1 hypothetical protein AWX17_26330 [Priestia megaterium]MCP1452232.1 negative regulator of replication initiation [Priestia megaterium]
MALSSEARAALLRNLLSLPQTVNTTTTSATDLLNAVNPATTVTNALNTINPTTVVTDLLNTVNTTTTGLLSTVNTTTTDILNTTTGLVSTTTTSASDLLRNLLSILAGLPISSGSAPIRNDLKNRVNQTVQISTPNETITGVLLAVLSDYVAVAESDGSLNYIPLSKVETVSSL